MKYSVMDKIEARTYSPHIVKVLFEGVLRNVTPINLSKLRKFYETFLCTPLSTILSFN